MKISSQNKKSIDFSPEKTQVVFFFGNSPDLAKKEVECVAARLLPFLKYDSMITRQVALYKPNPIDKSDKGERGDLGEEKPKPEAENLSNMQNNLGGTIKIAQVIASLNSLDNLENILISNISNENQKKVTLGISNFTNQPVRLKQVLINLKKQLKEKNIACRFILGKDTNNLSTAEIFHNRLDLSPNIEFNILASERGFLIAQTVTVQNPDDWSKRDFGIPAADAQSGMLPPKLARMMLNLRIRDIGEKRDAWEIIVDPFCGNGRVLLEAAYLGLDFFGSDIDPVKVEASKANLRWLRDWYHLPVTDEEINQRVFVADAQTLNKEYGIPNVVDDSKFHIPNSTFQIVTEPNLGPALHSLPDLKKAENIANSLTALYINSVKNLIDSTNSGTFVIPAWKTQEGNLVELSKKILDNLTDSGYDLNKLGEYTRPNSFIIREIWHIKKPAAQHNSDAIPSQKD